MNKQFTSHGWAGKSLTALFALILISLLPAKALAGESDNPDEVLLDSATALKYTKDGVVLQVDLEASLLAGITDLVIPASIHGVTVTQIGDGEHSILDIRHLINTITLSDDMMGVTIKKNAFADFDLSHVEIPEGVTTIEPYAFSQLRVRQSLVFKQANPETYSGGKGYSPEMFGAKMNKIVEIQVPDDDSIDKYKSLLNGQEMDIYLIGSDITSESLRKEGITYELYEEAKEAYVKSASTRYGYDSIDIPSTITANGIEYTVVGIRSRAFSLVDVDKEIRIPSTVNMIDSRAFFFWKPRKFRLYWDYKGNDFEGFDKRMFGDFANTDFPIIVPEGRAADFKEYFTNTFFSENFVQWESQKLELTDENGCPQKGMYDGVITYNRKLTEQEKNGYVNVVLPFSVFINKEPFLSQVEAAYYCYQIVKKDNGEYLFKYEDLMHLDNPTWSRLLKASVPLMLKVKKGVSELNFTYDPENSITFGPVLFWRNDGYPLDVIPVVSEEGDVIKKENFAMDFRLIQSEELSDDREADFYQIHDDGTIGKYPNKIIPLYRAILRTDVKSDDAAGLTIKTDLPTGGDATGILPNISATKPAQQKAAIYGIDGKLVRPAGSGMQGLSKGIYVQGGKKIVVK